MSLSRDAILGADDIQTEPVTVPEWGGEVIVRSMSAEDRDAFEASIRQMRPSLDGKGMEPVLIQDNARAKLLVKCLVGEDGERLFTDNDAPALGKKNGKIVDRLYDIAARLSGISEEAQAELEGNSEAPVAGASTSSSLETSSTAP